MRHTHQSLRAVIAVNDNDDRSGGDSYSSPSEELATVI